MPLDQHAAALIAGLGDQGLPPFHQMTPEQIREVIDTFTGLQLPPQPVARVSAAKYRSAGHELNLNIYSPGNGPRPVILYFHGGGFVGGTLAVVDEPARALTNATGAFVVTASYRLAPEHKFPAAPDDAFAALTWVSEHIAEYDGDPGQIILMGDSAGGNLAAVTALRVRDSGGPAVCAQILAYPVLDPTARFASRTENAEGFLIDARDMDYFWDKYLAAPSDVTDAYAVPSRGDLRGLPPTLILTTEFDVARDEARDYGRQLTAVGVETRVIGFDGLVHAVLWMSGAVPRSAELYDAVTQFVTEVTSPVAVR